jgi:hypothetical protein
MCRDIGGTVHWDRARHKFDIAGNAVYDDEDAERFAEDGIQNEALDHWDPEGERRGRRTRDWWNRPAARDFMLEREIDLLEINEMLFGVQAASGSKRSRKRKSSGVRTGGRTR